MGIGGELTGIEGKSFAAALALIPLLPTGESTLDKMGIGITTAGATFGCSVFKLSIQFEIFHCDSTKPTNLFLAQLADQVYQSVSAHCFHPIFVLMVSLYWAICLIIWTESKIFN